MNQPPDQNENPRERLKDPRQFQLADTNKKRFSSKLLFRVFSSLSVLGLLLSSSLWFQYLNNKDQAIQVAKTNASLITSHSAEEIDTLLTAITPLADSLANELSEGVIDRKELLPRLRKILDNNTGIRGVGVAYAPNQYDPEIRLFAPMYIREGGSLNFKQVESLFDYTLQEHDWYSIPFANRSPIWTEPELDPKTGDIVARYGVPFYKPGNNHRGEPAGVVFLQLLLNQIKTLVGSLDLGKTGYGFILSKKGRFLSHPIEKYVKSGLSLFDLADQQKDDTLRIVGAQVITGKNGSVEHVNPATGQLSWMFFEPIPSTGWSMVVVFVREKIGANTQQLRQQEIWIAMSAVIVLSLLSVLLTRAYLGGLRRIWTLMLTISLLFMCGIAFIWHLTIRDPINEEKRVVTIVDRAGLDNFLTSLKKSMGDSAGHPPVFIPTGLFVQSMEFSNANNTILTGYVWQKFQVNDHDQIERGFLFPELSSSDDMEIEEQFRRIEGNVETVQWYFRVVLRERFDYSHYPFDKANIWIRLWSKDFNNNVILIPDLEAYTLINPTSLPGLEKDLFLPGWTFQESYFDYKYNTFTTDFGKISHRGHETLPEMYFNIVARRNFLGPFISNLIPIIVVSFMLFGLLMIGSKHSEKSSWLNFNAQDILASCAALVFVIILAHIDLRGTLAAEGILYLEYFYFVMYIATLMITINAILFSWDIQLKLIQYEDNLIPKLMFWPLITGCLLVLTLVIFY